MFYFNGMKVGVKLIVSFLIVALIGAIIGAVGVISLGKVNGMAANMYQNETLGIRYAAEAKKHILAIETELRNVFLASEPDGRENALANIQQLFTQLDQSFSDADKSFNTEEGKQLLGNVRTLSNTYKNNMENVLVDIDEQFYFYPSPLVNDIVETVEPVADELNQAVENVIDGKTGFAERYNTTIANTFSSVRNSLLLITVIGVIIAVALGVLLARGLLRQLGGEPDEVVTIANAIADGKLDNTIDSTQASTGSVMYAMNQMQQALRNTVANVLQSSDNIAAGSHQIASGNMDLSQRTEEQSANVTETASAIEEISSTLRSNADAANKASELAQVVRAAAEGGQVAVDDVVTSIAEMQASSEEIVNIINVIDSIAFQTNILALNAAVESARAGEAGRGFAVVASEVRTLAQRSAAAAQDIKALIEGSVSKVSEGNQKAHVAGDAITSMVDQVNRVATLIDEISAATLEQNMGVEQVNQAISQLEEVTQQNASLVENSAMAAATLSDQAGHLVDVVRVFDLGSSGHGQQRPALPA